jgi:hypothetical protein
VAQSHAHCKNKALPHKHTASRLLCQLSKSSKDSTTLRVVRAVTVKNAVFLMTPCSLLKMSEPAASIVRTEYCLFDYNAVQSGGHLWTCTRNVLRLFSEEKTWGTFFSETLVKFCQTALRHSSE